MAPPRAELPYMLPLRPAAAKTLRPPQQCMFRSSLYAVARSPLPILHATIPQWPVRARMNPGEISTGRAAGRVGMRAPRRSFPARVLSARKRMLSSGISRPLASLRNIQFERMRQTARPAQRTLIWLTADTRTTHREAGVHAACTLDTPHLVASQPQRTPPAAGTNSRLRVKRCSSSPYARTLFVVLQCIVNLRISRNPTHTHIDTALGPRSVRAPPGRTSAFVPGAAVRALSHAGLTSLLDRDFYIRPRARGG
ncbi:hypothetical protein HYPSUDRAFT_201355 [Hypholoma sublateritium FD-334 SS-4]|uniref:Uncharacterized protein n=1 Tax=Hypholoma sublateritium (strain FD-334 SS-4) TaxID=945553 RepID=A0A0D2PUQ2_HYPSF|nr:hypothetical protein HYPSUDRAFT_209878 [Hypholoma sublateritium FD-334 SS-4]KJA23325.1 hypothetical protein HYPSUDRAFT_201355 [Hypholoma sublateritium FD-334 SS-4]